MCLFSCPLCLLGPIPDFPDTLLVHICMYGTSCVCLGATALQLLPNNNRLFTLLYRTLERECSPSPRRHCVLLRRKEGKDLEGVWGITHHWIQLYPFFFFFFFLTCASFGKEIFILAKSVQCSQISSERGYQFRCLNGSQWFRNPISSLGVEQFWQ